MPNQMTFNVVLTGLVGLALLVLSVVELRKPSPVAKMTGLTWLLFAVAIDSVSLGLFIMEPTWHLPNAQKPWAWIITLDSIAFYFFVLATVMLMRVVAAKEAEIAERKAEMAGTPHPTEGVWPPPPTGP